MSGRPTAVTGAFGLKTTTFLRALALLCPLDSKWPLVILYLRGIGDFGEQGEVRNPRCRAIYSCKKIKNFHFGIGVSSCLGQGFSKRAFPADVSRDFAARRFIFFERFLHDCSLFMVGNLPGRRRKKRFATCLPRTKTSLRETR